MGKIIAVSRSERKGTKKISVSEGVLKENYGLVGDAHADCWTYRQVSLLATCWTYRQVSLLATGSIDKMRQKGFDVGPGDFAENLTCEGIDLVSLSVGTQVSIGKEVIIEVTQIGKQCHTRCAIYRQVGKCVMPLEGVFAKVTKGGSVKAGDAISVLKEKKHGDREDYRATGGVGGKT